MGYTVAVHEHISIILTFVIDTHTFVGRGETKVFPSMMFLFVSVVLKNPILNVLARLKF
jgi:hypothetical protein